MSRSDCLTIAMMDQFAARFFTGLGMIALPLAAEEAVNPQSATSTPRLQVAAEDVIATHTVRCGGRDVTFCKLKPLSLPALPEPEPARELTEAEIEELRQSIPEKHLARRHVFIGASTYVVRDEEGTEQYYSRVRCWLNQQREAVDFWTNSNFVWLSGQMAEFEIGDQHYSLMLTSSLIDASVMEKAIKEHYGESEWKFVLPNFPEFESTGVSSIQVVGDVPSDEALAPMKALLSYYDANKLQLKASYEQRRAEYEKRQKDRLANPPEAKNLVLRYWRLDQPAEKAAIIE